MAPDAVIALLTHLWGDPKHARIFRSTLPVSGVSGSLADRMKAADRGQVWAETGTLSNVRTLSGSHHPRRRADRVLDDGQQLVTTADIDASMEKALLRVFQYQR